MDRARRTWEPEVSVIETAAAGIPRDLEVLIEDIVGWRRAPTGWRVGRTAWQVLDDPIDVGGRVIRSLKFKGIGSVGRSGSTPTPPSPEPFDRSPGLTPEPHFGIRPDLEFVAIQGAAAPLGGIVVEAALRELRLADRLQVHGVPTLVPLVVYRYDGLHFEGGDAMGAVVMGCNESHPFRASALFDVADPDAGTAAARYVSSLARPRTGEVDVDWAAARLELVGAAYEAFGRSLDAFSAAGCYRYSGHPDNFVLTEDGGARLVDLDSSHSIHDLPADVAGLQVVRDAMSGLYNLAVAFIRPDAVRGIPDDLLTDANPFGRFLRGRYPDVQLCCGEGRGVAELIVEARRRLRPFNDQIISDPERGGVLQRHLQHDRDLLFCACFRICHQMHTRSLAAQRVYPSPFSDDDLDDRLLRFAGRSRFERVVEVGSSGRP